MLLDANVIGIGYRLRGIMVDLEIPEFLITSVMQKLGVFLVILLNQHHDVVSDGVFATSTVTIPLAVLLLPDAEVVGHFYPPVGEEHGVELCRALNGPTDAIIDVILVVSRDTTDEEGRILKRDMLGDEEDLIVAEFQDQMLFQEVPQAGLVHLQADSHHEDELGSDCAALLVDVDHLFDKGPGIDRDVVGVLMPLEGERGVLQTNLIQARLINQSAVLFQFHFIKYKLKEDIVTSQNICRPSIFMDIPLFEW